MEKRTALPNVMCRSIFIKHDIESHAGILHNWTAANKTNQSVERPPSGDRKLVGGEEKIGGRKRETDPHREEEDGWNKEAEEE